MRTALERQASYYAKLFADFMIGDAHLATQKIWRLLERETFFLFAKLGDKEYEALYAKLVAAMERTIFDFFDPLGIGSGDEVRRYASEHAKLFAFTLIGDDEVSAFVAFGNLAEKMYLGLPKPLMESFDEHHDRLREALYETIVGVVHGAGYGGRKRWKP